MFWFVMISIIGIVALGISLVFWGIDASPSGLWITICCISVALVVIGGVGGSLCLDNEEKNATIQEERIEDECQYNYCPYCGREIK